MRFDNDEIEDAFAELLKENITIDLTLTLTLALVHIHTKQAVG